VDEIDAPSQPVYTTSINKIIRFTKSQDSTPSGPPPDDNDSDDDNPPGPSGGLIPLQSAYEGMDVTDDVLLESLSPGGDEEDVTSVRSGSSSVKRRAPSQERSARPSKRTRAHTVEGFFPALSVDERNQITVTTLLDMITQLTISQYPETAKKKEHVMGQFVWKPTDTTKVLINISTDSDESYFTATKDIISVLTQGKAMTALVHHFSSKSDAIMNTLNTPAEVVNHLTILQPNLSDLPIGQIIVGLVCFFLQWGFSGTKKWSATTVTHEATPGLRSYFDMITEATPNYEKFFQDCYQSLVSRKSRVLLLIFRLLFLNRRGEICIFS
jgi:hypothetical protein